MISPAAWDFRLRGLIGVPLVDVTEKHLNELVENGVREDVDLDFKQESHGNGESAKRELAGDFAAMANERGGLIIIGIRDEEDVAAELTPIELADGDEARFRMIVAANAAPNVDFDIKVIESEGAEKQGYLLIAIPPSPLRPHAVRKDNDLRYPRRNGTTRRWLGESEVADMYRDRFRLATDQTERSVTVLQEGIAQVELEEKSAYLTVALVPAAAGSMTISRDRISEMEEWAVDPLGTYFWRGFFGSRPRAQPGLRRVVLAYGLGNHEQPKMPYAELHSDGTGFTCECINRPVRGGLGPENLDRICDPESKSALGGR